jgi:dethiobiotin synthetase
MKYFVTGIDTDSGKTVASAILCEMLGADYWKPVQAGLPRDADTVKSLITNLKTRVHPERFLLTTPASPHASAKIDGIEIKLSDFSLPDANHLIAEGAGGCLVPLNDSEVVIDIARNLNFDVIVVADLYLGSINHTLLTLEAITSRGLRIQGIIFNGDANPESQRVILKHFPHVPMLLHIRKEKNIDKDTVRRYAEQLRKNWNA